MTGRRKRLVSEFRPGKDPDASPREREDEERRAQQEQDLDPWGGAEFRCVDPERSWIEQQAKDT